MGRLTKEQRRLRVRDLMFELRWPMFAACMARAARSSGMPFVDLARAAKAARKAFAEHKWSTWIGVVSGDCSDPRNWRYGRLPRDGDLTVVFDDPPGHRVTTNMDLSGIAIETLVVTRAARNADIAIGKQGRAL